MASDEAYIVASIETATMYFNTMSEEGQLWLPPPYDVAGIAPGYYVIVGKGCLRHRLAIMGVMTAVQEDLTNAQKYLRMAAHVQQMHMSDPVCWRTIKKDEDQSWGPERPAFANGALCYLNARDAPVVEAKAGELGLMSKHIVISAEYVPILCEVYNTVYAMWNMPGQMIGLTGRAAYVFVKAALLCEFRWYDANEQGPIALTRQDIRRRREWASLDSFDEGKQAGGKRAPKVVRGGRMPLALLVNPNYESTGEKPWLTTAALADVACMTKHALAAGDAYDDARERLTKFRGGYAPPAETAYGISLSRWDCIRNRHSPNYA